MPLTYTEWTIKNTDTPPADDYNFVVCFQHFDKGKSTNDPTPTMWAKTMNEAIEACVNSLGDKLDRVVIDWGNINWVEERTASGVINKKIKQ